jgi:hypothetical protein
MSLPANRITRDDVEARFRSLATSVETKRAETSERLRTVVIGGGVVLLILTFLLGRRRGTRRTSIVEVRRF